MMAIRDVARADTGPAARFLMRRFLALCDALQVMDVDRDTLGEAANLADAERLVLAAIHDRDLAQAELDRAEAELAEAEEDLAEAEAELAAADTKKEKNAARAAVAAAAQAVKETGERVSAARATYRAAVRHFVKMLRHAAECADRLRHGLRRRHGGIASAAQTAPAPMANRDFYQ